jgi:hypothetical protein
MEEKQHRDKNATCASFFDLTKRATELEEINAKAKSMEAEAKLLAKERDHVSRHEKHGVGTKGLGGEEASYYTTMRDVIARKLVLLFLCPSA